MTSSHSDDPEIVELRGAASDLAALSHQVRAESDAAIAEIEALRAELEREREGTDDDSDAATDSEQSAAQLEVRQRVERGETTWRDVLSGVDTHRSAEEVRRELAEAMGSEMERLRAEDPEFDAEVEMIQARSDIDE